jgi:hypothetical protein
LEEMLQMLHVHTASSLVLLIVWASILQESNCFAEISGSCNGLFGIHIPNQVFGDGGYRIVLENPAVGSDANRIVTVAIRHVFFFDNFNPADLNKTLGTGIYSGFLIKSYDPVNGMPLGLFQQPLPPHTALYDGCPVPETAVTHILSKAQLEEGEGGFSAKSQLAVRLKFSWPASSAIAFQLFVVEGPNRWFEVRGLSVSGEIASIVPREPPLGCLPQASVGSVLVGFTPVMLVVLVGLLLMLESTAAIINQLNHVFVLGPKYEGLCPSESKLSPGYWLHLLTFGAWETIAAATVVEAIAHVAFFSTQVGALFLAAASVPCPLSISACTHRRRKYSSFTKVVGTDRGMLPLGRSVSGSVRWVLGCCRYGCVLWDARAAILHSAPPNPR